MTWFKVVSLRGGNVSAYELEKRFDSDLFKIHDTKMTRPKKWERYRDGERVPSDLRPDDVVSLVDAAIPGTARWFRSPLWHAITGSFKSQAAINAKLRELDDVQHLLFFDKRMTGPNLIRRIPMDEAQFDELRTIQSIDTIAAIVLMAREAEVIASPELRDMALMTYYKFQSVIRTMPEFTNNADVLFYLIESNIPMWKMTEANYRLEMRMFSNPVITGMWNRDHPTPHDPKPWESLR